MVLETAATTELSKITEIYAKILPLKSFPWIVLLIASIAQFFAWFGGRYLFPNAKLFTRTIMLWLIAGLEFIILIPGIGASVEILGYTEAFLAIIFHAFQLIIFFVLNKFTLKSEFSKTHLIAFTLMIVSVIVAAFAK